MEDRDMIRKRIKMNDARKVLVIAVAVALMASVGNAADSAANKDVENKCALKLLSTIELVGPEGGLVPVTVQSKPALMWLNIGSAGTLINVGAVDMLGLAPRTLNTSSKVKLGDVSVDRFVDVEGLRVGNIGYAKTGFLVNPKEVRLPKFNGVPVIGGIGMDLFANVDIEVDLSRRTLKIFSQDHCPGQVVYWTNQYATTPMLKGRIGEVYFPMELDGKKIEAIFAPLSPTTTLSVDVTKKLYDFDQESYGNEKILTPSGQTAYYYRAMQMTAPGLVISNARIQLTDPLKQCSLKVRGGESKAAGYRDCSGAYPLRLGQSVMQKMRIYFAMKEETIYYSSADATR
jgi:hypothetical protein